MKSSTKLSFWLYAFAGRHHTDTQVGVCLFFVRPSDYRPNGLTLVGLDPTPHFNTRYCQKQYNAGGILFMIKIPVYVSFGGNPKPKGFTSNKTGTEYLIELADYIMKHADDASVGIKSRTD